GGTARFSSGLSTQSFLKRMSLIEYSRDALAHVAPKVSALGGAEDLAAHVEAVQVRVR
ncbi:MAG: Histidinol dehydrogenase, partial [Frankiales bacterium]|nr:Histidinol dehydrogenase [Frankiales bacterium]